MSELSLSQLSRQYFEAESKRTQELLDEVARLTKRTTLLELALARSGTDALVFDLERLTQQLATVREAFKPSRIVKSEDGDTTLLEWQRNGVYLECEIIEPLEWMLVVNKQSGVHWTTPLDSPIGKWITTLVAENANG